jgi:RNA polymerase sigma-70 factor (ECF subfamily)
MTAIDVRAARDRPPPVAATDPAPELDPAAEPAVVVDGNPAVEPAGAKARARDHATRMRLEALYAEHAPAVLRYARRRSDQGTADDVVAETFLVAWRRRDAVPDDALPWLYAVAGNVLRNQRRSTRRQASLRDRLEAQPAPATSPTPTVSGTTDHGLLRALATLRPIDREAILLTAWEELSAERAAAAAGCSPAAFHVRLHRAKRRLAKALDAASATASSSPSPTTDQPEHA